MPTDRQPVKTVSGIPIYLSDDQKFYASFGKIHMARSRLREVETAIQAWASQTPTTALTINRDVPTGSNRWGSPTRQFHPGFDTITITGHRDGKFRRGDRGRDVVHDDLYVDTPELRARLDDIARRCYDALNGFRQEWEAARSTAEELTPEHLNAPCEATR